MYQPHHYRQEVTRQQHAEILREVRMQRVAGAIEAERRRVRLQHLLAICTNKLSRLRRPAHARRVVEPAA